MRHETIKLELINWLSKLEDTETIQYLKIVKDSKTSDHDWWNDLTELQKEGIERGFTDIDSGRIVPHADVKKKYGL